MSTPAAADYFVLLDVPRRPGLDVGELKRRYLRLSAEQHPDLAGGSSEDRFSLINAAYAALRDPARRLAHLLELENHPLPENAAPPAGLADLFFRIGGVKQPVDNAALLEPLQRELAELQGQAAAQLEEADAVWTRAGREALPLLAALRSRFVFLNRCSQLLRELELQAAEAAG